MNLLRVGLWLVVFFMACLVAGQPTASQLLLQPVTPNSLNLWDSNELQSIAELFLLARNGLDHWSSDDSFLVNMGSICEEDIDEEGSKGRDELLEILAMADLPKVSIVDLDVKADDLQAILPAVASVLEVFALPGLKKSTLKKFNEAVDAAFGQVSLNTVSAEVEQKVGDILNGILKKNIKPEVSRLKRE